MRPGEYSKVEDPPEYSGNGWSWCHKIEVICRFGFFHCPGDICEHKERNGMFGVCVPDEGWVMKPAKGNQKLKLKYKRRNVMFRKKKE